MKRKIEELSPVTYEESLKTRARELEKLIKSKNAILQTTPELKTAGKIRIVPHRSKLQFYHITKKNDTTGKYLPRSKDEFAHQLIQYDYDTKVLRAAEKEYSVIQRLLNQNKKSGVQKIFQRFSKVRKTLINPVTLSDKTYAEQWLSRQYAGNNFSISGEFYTSKGEHVRSKSEVIIADTLARLNIPYRYEYPLELKSDKTIYPDFCCLNLRTRQEIYWEHFGLMDDPEYLSTAITKIQKMQESGYKLGEHFIFTMENSELPLNSKFIQTMAEAYLC